MGLIIFQIAVILAIVALLAYVARDDRRNRVLRAAEDRAEKNRHHSR